MQAIHSPRAGDAAEVARATSDRDGGGGTFFFDTTHITGATVASAQITEAGFDPAAPGPIVITAPGHHFVSGQVVLVEGVRGNTNANGQWMIAVDPHSPDSFTLIGSRGNRPYEGGGRAVSVTVTTFGPHGLAPGGRAVVDGVNGKDGFSLDGRYLPVGVTAPNTFTLAVAPIGLYSSGGSVGDEGLSFPCSRASGASGRWVRRRDVAELSVAWFGAVGNGAADDTEPLLATIRATRAVTGGHGVYLPGGNFRITAEIITGVSDFGISIRGAGTAQPVFGGTQITASGTGMRSVLSIGAGWVTLKGISLNGAGVADHGLHLQGAAGLHLDDVFVGETVKDGYRVVGGFADDGTLANNDNIYAREVSAVRCGTMFCSPSVADRYSNLRLTTPVGGAVSCQAGDVKVTGAGTDFTSIPARPGDFIVIGDHMDDGTLERLEIVSIDGPDRMTVQALHPPARTLPNQPFAIGVGDGWSDALEGAGEDLTTQLDCSRTRMDTGKFTSCAGSGIVSRARYGPLLENQEFFGCGFAGIVIGTLSPRNGLGFNTVISHPYFEATPFLGGCVFIGQARGITIDQPMWFGHPDHRRLVLNEVSDRNSGIIGCLADFVTAGGATGLQPVGFTTTSGIDAVHGNNFTNRGTFTMPSSGAAVIIDRSPWTTPIPVAGRNLSFVADRGSIDSAADITAMPTFLAGADGQEIAVCNVSEHPLTFHDCRLAPAGTLGTGLVLDCEPGGSVSLPRGRILTLYFSLVNSMGGRWTQRGAVSTSTPVISSLDPGIAHVAGGDSITVTGKNLDEAIQVYIGSLANVRGTITAKTFASLTFITPPLPAGTYNVLVLTGHGASNVLPIKTVS
ncbi:IPT/TIG domain-containing protein [Streptomyces hesseae]|uniref:Glycosyl hydrolase family 28-related protein n=1 Tax=Streptomyces hesseae TaxID=3075519 RepID=A0ABU2SYG6_9ACTN|nr:glycosyl hydrolase family 28-related protein [Streptomyces sp. DSM 40473]MDT0453768.1 glycosyl hydrolase family 28-related protein [Streptomyces sp. DSM 40473]